MGFVGTHHHHHHHHSGGNDSAGRLAIAFFLNLSFAILEFFGGWWTNSIAITSDAVHDFGDALAIGFALAMERVSKKKSDENYSYGYRRLSVFSALVTGLFLLGGSIYVLSQAIPRLLHPQQPEVNGMLVLAVLGVAVNGFAAWRVSGGTSLSERMIVLHLLEDVLGWVIVLLGAIFMKFFDRPEIDSLMGIGLAGWIIWNAIRNMREALKVFFQGVPDHINLKTIEDNILKIPGILSLHHLHLWSLDGEHHIFTGHLVLANHVTIFQQNEIKKSVKALLKKDHIFEATLEIEHEGLECADPQHRNPHQ